MTEREFNHMIRVLEDEEDFWETRMLNAHCYTDEERKDDAREHKECVHILTELREKKHLFVQQQELQLEL